MSANQAYSMSAMVNPNSLPINQPYSLSPSQAWLILAACQLTKHADCQHTSQGANRASQADCYSNGILDFMSLSAIFWRLHLIAHKHYYEKDRSRITKYISPVEINQKDLLNNVKPSRKTCNVSANVLHAIIPCVVFQL